MFKKSIFSLALVLVLVPSLVFAQELNDSNHPENIVTNNQIAALNNASDTCKGQPKDFGALFNYAICLLSGSVVPFLIGLALVLLMVGIVQYVRAGDNEEKREAGRNMMLFGIISLFVMVSVWGFVKILYNSFFEGAFEIGSLPPVSKTPFK